MRHQIGRLARLLFVWVAWVVAAMPVAMAQTNGPFTCDGTFYQVRQNNNSQLYRINRGVSPYTATQLYDTGYVVNAMGYNPVDNYLYGLRNPVSATAALIRMGTTAPVDLNGAAAGTAIPVPGLANVGHDGGDIDGQGRYFVVQAGSGPILRISGITGASPSPTVSTVTHVADASPPSGYTGSANFLIGDIAVHPGFSTATQTVFYGVRAAEGSAVYLYRFVIANPGATSPSASVSRIATNLPLTTYGSSFFDAAGTFYVYDNSSTAAAGFYSVNVATGQAANVSGAASASSSDGGTCAFAPQSIDVVKRAASVTSVNATTFDVSYNLIVGNRGTLLTPNVQVSDSLARTFATGSPTLTLSAAPAVAAPCTGNAGFNGVSDTRLLTGSNNLAPGQSCAISFTVRVTYPSLVSVPAAPQLNTAYASSVSGVGPNPGYTFPGGSPTPPVNLITADESTDAPTLPVAPNGDTPTPTPVQFPQPPRISIDKSANPPGALVPGGTVTYTVVVSNVGSSPAPNTLVQDTLPAGIASATWTCAATGGAVCPNATGSGSVNETVATFPAGSTLTWTITATVGANPPANIVNVATANPPSGLCFPGDTLPPCSDSVTSSPVPIIEISKSTSNTVVSPGGSVTWSLVVRNAGSAPANGTVVTDPLPAGITSATWSCAAIGGAVCPNSTGVNAINQTVATFPAGSQLTWTIVGTVSPNPSASIVNIGRATPPACGICANGSSVPCQAQAQVLTAPRVGISKTVTSAGPVVPNGTIQYTIVVNNGSANAAHGTVVNDPFPAGIVSATWTCSAAAGATCPNAVSPGVITPPAPMLNQTIANLPSGGSVTYVINAIVSATPPASIVNTATANPPAGGVCLPANSAPPCSATASSTPAPVIQLTKSANVSILVPGGTVVYTVTARNTGSVSAGGTVVSDPIPFGLTTPFTWTCAATSGAVCPNASGSGALSQTVATFPAGGELTWTITATVVNNPSATITNTASANPPSGGVCADGAVPPCRAAVELPVAPQVSVTKTADVAVAVPGGNIVWTVTVSNGGSVAAPGTQISDPLPAGIASTTWSCTASNGAICQNANGAGALNETIATFPPTGTLVYTITGVVANPAPTNIVNTVSVVPPNGRCLPGNTVPPCTDIETTPSAPNVVVTKALTTEDGTEPGVVEPGETLIYTVTLANSGGSAFTGFDFVENVPVGATLTSITGAGVTACAMPVTGPGTCPVTVANVTANGNTLVTVVFEIDDPIPAGVSQITNLLFGGDVAPGCPAPNVCSTTHPVTDPVVSVEKSANPASGTAVTVGQTITYTLSAQIERAPLSAPLEISDTLGAGLSLGTVTPTAPFVCNAINPIECSLPTSTGPGTYSVSYTATVNQNALSPVANNVVIVEGGGDDDPVCTICSTSHPLVAPAVTVSKTSNPANNATVNPNQTITYTLSVNVANSATTAPVTLTDTLGAGLTLVPGSLPAACSAVSQVVTCTLAAGALPSGSPHTFNYQATVDEDATVSVGNSVTASGDDDPTCTSCSTSHPIVAPTTTLDKAANPVSGTDVNPGDTITYTLTVNVSNSATTEAITLTDTLGVGLTLVPGSLPGACSAVGQVVTCTLVAGALPSGNPHTFVYQATVDEDATGTVGNSVVGTTPDGGDPNPVCGTCATEHPITAPIVTVEKSANPPNDSTVNPEDTITYTLSVNVANSATTAAVTLTDTLGAGLTLVPGSLPAACSAVGQIVTCTLAAGALPSGNPHTFVYQATVDEDATVSVGNSVTASGDDDPTCTSCSTSHPIVAVETLLTKSSNPESGSVVEPGDTIVYTLSLRVENSATTEDITLTDTLGAGLTLVPGSLPAECSAAGQIVTCTLAAGALPSGSPYTFVYQATVDDDATGVLTNAVEGSTPPGGDPDPICDGCDTEHPLAPAVTLVKSLVDEDGEFPGVAEPGETLTYEIVLSNTGGVEATGFGVTDELDANTNFVSADNGGAHAAGVVTWTGLEVPPHDGTNPGELTLQVVVTVDDPLSPDVLQIANLAYETGTVPPACPPAGDQCVITPTIGQVTIAKAIVDEDGTVDGIAEPGEILTYEITLTNAGGTDATNFGVTDELDANTDFVSADNGGAHTSGVVTWSGLTVPGGGNLVLTVQAQVVAAIPAGVTQIANLAYETGTTPPDCPPAGPQCATIPTQPAISVSKALSGESFDADGLAEPGEQLTYTITLRNEGGSIATDTLVTETVPANTTFVSGAPTWSCAPGAVAGTACEALIDVPAATGPTTPGIATLTFTIEVDDPLPAGVQSIANAVAINDGDPPDCAALPDDPACVITPTVNVDLSKAVTSVVPTGPSTYVVTYQIDVVNLGGSDAVYTLTDTLGYPTTGVVFTGNGQVTSIGGTVNPALPGGQFVPLNGTAVQLSAAATSLAIGATHAYIVAVPIGIQPSALQSGACTGEPGNGLYNSAAIAGTFDLEASACAPVSGDVPVIRLIKTVELGVDNNGNQYGDVGDVLHYGFAISNPGTLPLSAVQLVDPRVTDLQCDALTANGEPFYVFRGDELFDDAFEGRVRGGVLVPGDSIACTATYTLTQQDVDRRRVINSATASGAAPGGQVATSTSTAIFTAFR